MKIQEKVVDIIAETCGVDATIVLLKSRFDNGLQVDELRLIEIAMALEDEFNLKIPEGDLDEFETVGDVSGYIERIKGDLTLRDSAAR